MPRYLFETEKIIVTEYIVEGDDEHDAHDKIFNEEYEDATTKEYENTKLITKLDD
mgnify:CR=1 FL=1|tara:strand:- start:95 stop:259 length:165 start_codon:yes stop_codon:yes gene_type:complete